ncbi:GntR family transcriptional regulator [Sinorhizobium glycinis]|uniref:GntR family transcriptional regulator n=1 Tax=Sinorhizobium glycinis TaxID=1472378 RepID=A0A178XN44_9HYPH|nr:FadR/GntR family transcriptional regulator [Sinorhizobium glycinis]OAP36637.1 GntR family transcriptional regulator [Sinorhizobium glycinis]
MTIIAPRGNLAQIVVGTLTERLDCGVYPPGEKMPSSAELCEEFGVSRTVMREALASLKIAGRVVARQGSGVFVLERDSRAIHFDAGRIEDIRSAMDILELRLGVEMQSVALAAARRTPEALTEIARTYDAMTVLESDEVESEAKADFAFHMAIAKATRNPHFPRLLEALMGEINSELLMKLRQSGGSRSNFVNKIKREHAMILSAITQRDEKGAQSALYDHLATSLNRYRTLLDEANREPA